MVIRLELLNQVKGRGNVILCSLRTFGAGSPVSDDDGYDSGAMMNVQAI